MGDPFSITGTAVGITSLGIQVCQIIFRYYSQFRGIHEDLNKVVQYADGLQICLKDIEKVMKKIESEDAALSSSLQKALQECGEELARLKLFADKCGVLKSSQKYD